MIVSRSSSSNVPLKFCPLFCNFDNYALYGLIACDMCVPLEAYFLISYSTVFISMPQSLRKARSFRPFSEQQK